MNSGIDLSIVVPTTADHGRSPILRSYLESPVRPRLKVQFVFLLNDRKSIGVHRSEIMVHEDHEIVVVANDRYFGACEDNLCRVQDIGGLLKPIVFSVGDHDVIDWEQLAMATEHLIRHRIEALAWNIMGEQKLADGSYAGLAALTELNDDLPANDVVRCMAAGEIVRSNIGNAALTSVYGPIDWQAYLGCHLFARDVFLGILQYHFGESVYSLVYKQSTYFHHHPVSYGYWPVPVIYRRSDDFERIRQGQYSAGWLADHRTTAGASPVFWVANMRYLAEMRSDALFTVFVSSLCLSQAPAQGGGATYIRASTLSNLLSWSAEVVRDAVSRRSHYFPELKIGASLRDLRCVVDFWQALTGCSQRHPQAYAAIPAEFTDRMAEAMGLVSASLAGSSQMPERMRESIVNSIGAAARSLTAPVSVAFNRQGFQSFLVQAAGG